MRPAALDYVRPATLEDAIDALAQAGDSARPLAGGQALVNQMRARAVRPSVVVDISRLDNLRYLRLDGAELAVGALTCIRDLAGETARSACPALADAAASIADPQVRNRASAAGNLMNPDPVSDLAPVLLASGGSVVVQGPQGRRTIGAEDLFQTLPPALGAAEVIVELRFGSAGTPSAYEKLARRFADPAMVSAAAFATVDGGRIASCAVALNGAHDRPLRLTAVEQALTGAPADGWRDSDALTAFAAELNPRATAHADAAYRREVAPEVVLRAIDRAVRAATAR